MRAPWQPLATALQQRQARLLGWQRQHHHRRLRRRRQVSETQALMRLRQTVCSI